MENIVNETKAVIDELLERAKLRRGDICVIGCSTSEITGSNPGTNSTPQIAETVFSVIYEALNEKGIYIAAQCCEHLNRALVIEEEAAEKYGYEPVNVIPQPKAGGSFATAAYKALKKYIKKPDCPVCFLHTLPGNDIQSGTETLKGKKYALSQGY